MGVTHAGEVLNGWSHAACLRQPHEEIKPDEGVRGHLVEEDSIPLEYIHHSGIQGKAKTGGEEIIEDDNLVIFGKGERAQRRG
jgi:hypothetical protein